MKIHSVPFLCVVIGCLLLISCAPPKDESDSTGMSDDRQAGCQTAAPLVPFRAHQGLLS